MKVREIFTVLNLKSGLQSVIAKNLTGNAHMKKGFSKEDVLTDLGHERYLHSQGLGLSSFYFFKSMNVTKHQITRPKLGSSTIPVECWLSVSVNRH